MLTKKHFEVFAGITAGVRNTQDSNAVGVGLAKLSRDENPQFDADRFWDRVADIRKAKRERKPK